MILMMLGLSIGIALWQQTYIVGANAAPVVSTPTVTKTADT